MRSRSAAAVLPAAVVLVTVSLALVAACRSGPIDDAGYPAPPRGPLILGADVSMLETIETHGGIYRDRDGERDLLAILESSGFDHARLRLWHTPADGRNDLAQTLRMARRVTERGFGLLLDLHYSDTWTDPGHQGLPGAWRGLSSAALVDSVRDYTRAVVLAFAAQGTPPSIVQIGNEITCGMLWDQGRVCGEHDTPAQWDALASLVDAGIAGARAAFSDAEGGDRAPRIMIHIDRGGDVAGARWFLDHLLARGVEFEIIGLSYYPWWHGSLDDLRATLAALASTIGKEIAVVETGYPWTLAWHDDVHNVVGLPDQLHDGYPASPAGQRAFLTDVIAAVADVENGLGVGVFYWAPEYISSASLGSPWENLTLFDFDGVLLESADFSTTHRD